MDAALSKKHRHLEEEKVLLLLYPLHSLYGMNFRIENKCLAKRKKIVSSLGLSAKLQLYH